MEPGDEFSSVILVKVNFAEILKRELASIPGTRNLVALGTATDPYQPIERYCRLTRAALETLVEHPTPISLLTKGPLVIRDIDLLVELSHKASCTVNVSVPTVDEEA